MKRGGMVLKESYKGDDADGIGDRDKEG